MGAGNPLLRSHDEELYSAKTYFIDFSSVEENPEKSLEDAWDMDYESREFSELSEDEINEELSKQASYACDDFRECYFSDYDIPIDNTSRSELSAEYRGYALILAETKTGLILSTSDSEAYHYAIGIVPKISYEDIEQEMHDEHEEKWDWYQNHNKDFDAMIVSRSHKEYAKRIKQFLKENEPIMRKLHNDYGHCMSGRGGAWTSYSVKTIGKDFKFL